MHPVANDRNHTRPERVEVRLSPAEYVLIRRGARANGMTEAAFMRTVALMRCQEFRNARGAAADPTGTGETSESPAMGGELMTSSRAPASE